LDDRFWKKQPKGKMNRVSLPLSLRSPDLEEPDLTSGAAIRVGVICGPATPQNDSQRLARVRLVLPVVAEDGRAKVGRTSDLWMIMGVRIAAAEPSPAGSATGRKIPCWLHAAFRVVVCGN
jgi:hypothetical protein